MGAVQEPRPATLGLVLLMVLWTAPSGAAAQESSDSIAMSRAQADSVVDAFHAALERGDSTAVLAMLDPDVRIYESGEAETLDQYRSGHLAADIEFSQSVASRVVDGWTWLGDGEALVGRVYRAEGTFRGRAIDALTTETVFLVRTAEGVWRIRHIHWSSRRASPPPSP